MIQQYSRICPLRYSILPAVSKTAFRHAIFKRLRFASHPDLLTPGCKGSIISYKGPSDSAAAVYFSGPYSTTQRWNLTVMASNVRSHLTF